MASIIKSTTTDGIQIIPDSTGAFAIQTNGANTALTIDTSQNVGIGTTSPAVKLDIIGSSGQTLRLRNGTTATEYYDIGRDGANGFLSFNGAQSSPYVGYIWSTTGTERMRIDSSGYVLVGINSWATLVGAGSNITGTAILGGYITTRTAGTTSATCMSFRNDNNQVGSIYTNGTATTYLTSSDYRLKENIVPMTGALDKLAQLKPVTYNWKWNGSEGQGFIAHELQEVFPEAVGGEKDAVDEEGNILAQGIDTSFLVATLTAAIQEQQTIINDLKARIETLENK